LTDDSPKFHSGQKYFDTIFDPAQLCQQSFFEQQQFIENLKQICKALIIAL